MERKFWTGFRNNDSKLIPHLPWPLLESDIGKDNTKVASWNSRVPVTATRSIAGSRTRVSPGWIVRIRRRNIAPPLPRRLGLVLVILCGTRVGPAVSREARVALAICWRTLVGLGVGWGPPAVRNLGRDGGVHLAGRRGADLGLVAEGYIQARVPLTGRAPIDVALIIAVGLVPPWLEESEAVIF